jgi:UDP-glucose 4-epimerase
MMGTALITGGAGFIGSNVVRFFLLKGYQVRVLDNLSSGHKKNIEGLDIEFLLGDIRDSTLVHDACQGVDLIIHLAASVGRQKSLDNTKEDAEVNLIGTTIVFEEARKANIKKIVYSSSAAIFGELEQESIDEDHPQNPDSPYGVSKLAGEKQALCFAKLYDMKVICLRYFNVYGPHQRYDAYGNVIPIFAKRLFSNQSLTIYGDGEQTRDFINVRDVAMANYLAAHDAQKTGVYNIGSGSSVTINQLAQKMTRIHGAKENLVYAPRRPADVLHCQANIDKASRDLSFFPTISLDDGLPAYLEWYGNNEI